MNEAEKTALILKQAGLLKDFQTLAHQQREKIAALEQQNKQLSAYVIESADAVTNANATVQQYAKALQSADFRARMWQSICEKVAAARKAAQDTKPAEVQIVETGEFQAFRRGD